MELPEVTEIESVGYTVWYKLNTINTTGPCCSRLIESKRAQICGVAAWPIDPHSPRHSNGQMTGKWSNALQAICPMPKTIEGGWKIAISFSNIMFSHTSWSHHRPKLLSEPLHAFALKPSLITIPVNDGRLSSVPCRLTPPGCTREELPAIFLVVSTLMAMPTELTLPLRQPAAVTSRKWFKKNVPFT